MITLTYPYITHSSLYIPYIMNENIISSDNNIENCTICLDEIDTITSSGLDCCQHIFHVDCILLWGKRSKLCPLCKKQFHNILFKGTCISSSPDTVTDVSDENSETSDESDYEEDIHRCYICSDIIGEYMGTGVVDCHHCGVYVHRSCVGVRGASSWICSDCQSQVPEYRRPVRAPQTDRARTTPASSASCTPAASSAERSGTRNRALEHTRRSTSSTAVSSQTLQSLHWAEREIARQIQRHAERNRISLSWSAHRDASSSTPSGRSQQRDDGSVRLSKSLSRRSTLAAEVAAELAQRESHNGDVQDDVDSSSGLSASVEPPLKRIRRRSSAPVPSPILQTSTRQAPTHDVGSRNSASSSSVTGTSDNRSGGAGTGTASLLSRLMSSSSSSVPLSMSLPKSPSARRKYTPIEEKIPGHHSFLHSNGYYNATCGREITLQTYGKRLPGCDRQPPTLVASSSGNTVQMRDRIHEYMNDLRAPLEARRTSTSSSSSSESVGFSSAVSKIFALCTMCRDIKFVESLLDEGLLDIIAEYLLLSDDGAVMPHNTKEMLLRTIHCLPVRARHLIIRKSSEPNQSSGCERKSRANFTRLVRIFINWNKKSGKSSCSSLYRILRVILQQWVAVLDRHTHAATKLRVQLETSQGDANNVNN